MTVGRGPGGTGRFPQQNRPLKEGGPWGKAGCGQLTRGRCPRMRGIAAREKHGFPHGSEAELAGSDAGQSPASRHKLGASDAHDEAILREVLSTTAKNGAPKNAVTTPIGSSAGDSAVRAITSARTRKPAPKSTDSGNSNR